MCTICECQLTRYSGATLHSDDIHVILLSHGPPPLMLRGCESLTKQNLDRT